MLSHSPAFRFLSLFISGNLLGLYVNSYKPFYFLIVLLISILLVTTNKKNIANIILVISVGYFYSLFIPIHNIEFPVSTKQEFVKVNGIVKSKLPSSAFKDKYIISGSLTDDIYPISEYNYLLLVNQDSMKLNNGDKITAFGNIHLPRKNLFKDEFNESIFATIYGIDLILNAQTDKITIHDYKPNFQSLNRQQIQYISKNIDQIFSERNRGLIKSLLLGDRIDLDTNLQNEYINSGIVHILSVGGFHVALISLILYSILSFIRNRHIKLILFGILLLEVIFITDFQIPALRAALISFLVVLALYLKRYPNLLNICSASTLLCLLIKPDLFVNISFQLSTAALFGIILFQRQIHHTISKLISKNLISEYLVSSIAVSFSASLFTSILTAYYFGNFSLISILSNLILLPIFTLSLVYSIIALVFSLVTKIVAVPFALCTDFLLDLSNSLNSLLIDYLPLFFNNDNRSVLFAITFSIGILYIMNSKSKSNVVFKSCMVASGLICIYLLPQKTKDVISNSEILYKKDNGLIFTEGKSKLSEENRFRLINEIKRSTCTVITSFPQLKDYKALQQHKIITLNTTNFSKIQKQYNSLQ